MAFFGSKDPKDDVIEELRNERNYLRGQVDQLQAQLLAIHNANAYRLMHRGPDTDSAPAKPGPPSVYEEKATEYKPEFSLAKLEQLASGKIPD